MKTFPDHLVRNAGLAAFFAMAVVGWHFTDGTTEAVDANHAPPVTRSSRGRPPRAPGIRDQAVAKMAQIRSATGPVERLRATITLANKLPVSEFGKWLTGGWFTLREGAEFTIFSSILRDRWFQEDPEGFVLWSLKNDPDETSSSLIERWTAGDPQKVVDFFKRHPNTSAEFDALAGMAKDHPDLALQRLLELDRAGFSEYYVYGSDGVLQILAETSPAALDVALESLKDPVKSQAERILMVQNLKTDYAGELRKLLARPDGLDVYYEVASGLNGVPGKIFDDLASLPPSWRSSISSNAGTFIDADSAEKWWNADLSGAGFSEVEVNALQFCALQKMAANHPEFALQRMAELKIYPRESEYPDEKWIIIENALAAHPDRTAELIELLEPGKDREIASRILERIAEGKEEKEAKIVERTLTPEQWLEDAVSPEFESGREYNAVLRSWDPARIASLGEQFKTLPDEQKQRVARIISSNVSGSFFESNPPLVGEAIRYLLVHPPADSSGDTASEVASAYAVDLAVTEPETGREWVDSLPDGQPKLWAQKNLFTTWSEYDPKAAERWLKTLPSATQEEVGKKEKKAQH